MLIDYLGVENCRDCRCFVDSEGAAKTLCDDCWLDYSASRPSKEVLSKRDLSLTVVTAVEYSERMKHLIHNFKYFNDKLIAEDLITLLEPAWWALAEDLPQIPYLVPVPLHWTRRVWRGFNQSELLVEGLCQRLGLPHNASLLRRVKLTRPHHGLGRVERMRNVNEAFCAPPAGRRFRNGPPPCVVLVDDIFTSGATLLECSEALVSAGYPSVSALAVCRA